MKDDTKHRRASFSSGDETVNDNVNSNTPTRHRSKPNPRPVLFSSKSPEDSAVKFADRPCCLRAGSKGSNCKREECKARPGKTSQAISNQVEILGGEFWSHNLQFIAQLEK